MDIWIQDRLPNENKIILVFDNLEGLCLGYFVNMTFYSLDGIAMRDVCAWCSIPDRPSKRDILLGKVINKNIMRLE